MLTIHVGRLGTSQRKSGTLESREVRLGRDPDCEVVLDHSAVSAIHCRLVAVSGAAVVLDEGSTNGTWVNGQRLEHPTLVTLDDELVVWPFVVHVQSLVQGYPVLLVREREAARQQEESLSQPHRRKRTSWEVLGVTPKTSLHDVRAAYLKLVQEYNPDRVAQLAPDFQSLARRKSQEIQRAWEELQDMLDK